LLLLAAEVRSVSPQSTANTIEQMEGSSPTKMAANSRLAGLDTLRALAIVLVMAYHISWRLPVAFKASGKFGWMGVDLFFVLSGYLIGSQLLKPVRDGKQVSPLAFYRKRAYRILPAYLAVLLIYLLWPGWHEETGMSPLWQFLTFTENLFVDYAKNRAFSHVWSLCVEEHFYLLLPLIVLLLARKSAAWKTVAVLGFFFVLGIAVRWHELVTALRPAGDRLPLLYIERIYFPTYCRLDGLLAGIALAVIRLFRPAWWATMVRRGNWLMLAGCVLVGIAIWMFFDRFTSVTGAAAAGTVIGFPVLSLGMALWIPAASDVQCALGRWHIPGAKWVAMLAFSLYLTHKEVASLVSKWLPALTETRDWRTVPLYALSCMAVAAVLYFCVERPFLVLRDQRERRGTDVDLEARVDPAL
jgi:peptidoglycan/LPS O-acetylase OafA/YrhL